MTAFGDAAKYYDLLYADKDYAGECRFVRSVIKRHVERARTMLDLGCGSARHAVEFAKSGMSITGVDSSSGMIAQARNRLRNVPAEIRERITLAQDDVAIYRALQAYDAVVSLFHVVNYQTTDEALAGIFRAARRALRANGVFVFDFWYGSAVLAQGPERREKRVESDDLVIHRIAEPVLHKDRDIVEVHYTLNVRDRQSGRTETVREIHTMRYLFLPKIERVAAAAGLKIAESGEWLTGKPLSERCWSGYAAVRVE
jgi:SAM-dependent methyltransferase